MMLAPFFERLASWLRKRGVTALKPIHELRKEFGSMVNRKHGLSAAKESTELAGGRTRRREPPVCGSFQPSCRRRVRRDREILKESVWKNPVVVGSVGN
jgi:hypothetical protein